jgi:ABC-type nitrate/sulfonate/bicarbonate transport system substrate-binding protein
VLDRSTDLFDSYQGGIITASRAWAEANRTNVVAYLRGYLKGLDWTLDPANRAAGAELLMTKMPAIKPKVVDAVMDSLLSERTGLTPQGAVLRDGIQTVLDLRARYGGGSVSEIDSYLDLTYRDEALGGSR